MEIHCAPSEAAEFVKELYEKAKRQHVVTYSDQSGGRACGSAQGVSAEELKQNAREMLNGVR